MDATTRAANPPTPFPSAEDIARAARLVGHLQENAEERRDLGSGLMENFDGVDVVSLGRLVAMATQVNLAVESLRVALTHPTSDPSLARAVQRQIEALVSARADSATEAAECSHCNSREGQFHLPGCPLSRVGVAPDTSAAEGEGRVTEAEARKATDATYGEGGLRLPSDWWCADHGPLRPRKVEGVWFLCCDFCPRRTRDQSGEDQRG